MPLRFCPLLTSHPDARAMLSGYFGEIRARFGFDVSRQAALEDMHPPGGRFLVGYEADRPVACGGIRTWERGASCEIKRMFVVSDARRHGYGRELLAALEGAARDAGFKRVLLDTLDSLVEAVALYDDSGYARIGAYNENPYASAWFAKDL